VVDANLIVDAGVTLTLGQVNGVANKTLTKLGPGTLNLTGAGTGGNGALNAGGGTVNLPVNPGSDTGYSLALGATPAAGTSSLLNLTIATNELTQLRSLSVSTPFDGAGDGLLVIN